MDSLKLVIVDDHPAVRFGLESILNKFDDIRVVGVAEDGEQAVGLCGELQPDVALVDLCMPRMNGIETVRMLQASFPEISTIMLTQSDQDKNVVDAMDAGATGYLVKDAEISEIVEAIRAAARGRRTLSPEALEAIIRSKTAPQPHPDDQLSEREREVLHLMASGLKNPQIASELTVALSTVKFHISMIFKKLKVKTRTEAVVRAIELGLIDGTDE